MCLLDNYFLQAAVAMHNQQNDILVLSGIVSKMLSPSPAGPPGLQPQPGPAKTKC